MFYSLSLVSLFIMSSSSDVHVDGGESDVEKDMATLHQAWEDSGYMPLSSFIKWFAANQSDYSFIESYTLQQFKDLYRRLILPQSAGVSVSSKPSRWFPITAPNGPFSKMMVDLFDSHLFSHQYKYVLILIDVRTRYVAYALLHSKDGPAVKAGLLRCFHEVADVNGYVPSSFQLIGDKESAWKDGSALAKWLKDNGADCHFTDESFRAKAIVERFIGTLRARLRTLQQTHRGPKIPFSDLIHDIVQTHNGLTKTSLPLAALSWPLTGIPLTPYKAIQRPDLERVQYEARIRRRTAEARKAWRSAGIPRSYNVGDLVRWELFSPADQKSAAEGKEYKADYSAKKNPLNVRKGRSQFSGAVRPITGISKWGRYHVEGIKGYTFSADELRPARGAPIPLPASRRVEVPPAMEVDYQARRRDHSSKRRLNQEGLSMEDIQPPASKRSRRQADYGAFVCE